MLENEKRRVLLVGSLPFENEEIAMKNSLDVLANDLLSLPDGEIGEKCSRYPNGNRAAWIQSIIDTCEADTDNWKVLKQSERNEQGFPVGYDTEPRLKPKHSPEKMYKHLDFRWIEYFKKSYPVFKKLRKERGLYDLKFQVGLPTGLAITYAMMSPVNAIKYASTFNRRMAYEANEILKIADPGDVNFQIEVPGELAMAYKLPKFLVNLSVKTILGLANRIDAKASFGIHICFGDLNNEALTKAKTLDKMVHFSNHLVNNWPTRHKLDYVHYPLAEAATPPPMDEKYYDILKNIELPEHVRFVAGFVHDKISQQEHKEILDIVEKVRGHKVDIACSCGLGRRPQKVAEQLIKVSHELTKA